MTNVSSSNAKFHWADYVLFSICLLACVVIGLYHRFTGGRQKTTSEFLVGDRKLHLLPVALSLQATVFSASVVLGSPVEVYTFGIIYLWITLASICSIPIVVWLFIPIYRRTKLISAYEYLEYRYNRTVRILSAIAFLVKTVFYMGISLYIPALAFSQVTGLHLSVSEIGTGIICTFYTTIGGMKAVVWTDAFQVIVIGVGVFTLLIKGIADVGGLSEVANLAVLSGRLNYNIIDTDPTTRLTIWTQVIGGAAFTLSMYAADQTMVQRYLSLKTTAKAQIAASLGIFLQAVSVTFCATIGIVMTTYFYGCDPLKTGAIKKRDQLVPHFMMSVLGDYHGLPGIFLACVFSAALSTLSSGCNSMAAICLEDFVKPAYLHVKKTHMSEKMATGVSKLFALAFGLFSIAIANLAPYLGATVVQITIVALSAIGGPMLGVFLLGLLCPFSEAVGTIAGLLVGLITCFWIAVGSILHPKPPVVLPTTIVNCIANKSQQMATSSLYNITTITTTPVTWLANYSTSMSTIPLRSQEKTIYDLSFMWYALTGVLCTVITGIIVSGLIVAVRSFQGRQNRSDNEDEAEAVNKQEKSDNMRLEAEDDHKFAEESTPLEGSSPAIN